jgi:beta-lactamase regulating signal transducer with metallopeptidase domain
VTAWLTETCVTVTLLLLLVLSLRGAVARTFGAGWAYALWAVPGLRLILPPLPHLLFEIPLPTAAALIPAAAVGGTAPLPAEAGSWQWTPLILAVWAGGAVIFLGMQWLSYRTFLRRVEGSARPARPPLQGGIEAVVSEAVEGPLAMGLLRPRIVLPADFEGRYSPDEQRLALEHEITHHRRGDIWWNLAATLVLAANWFNPVAWIAFRAFRADQELSCDAAVAARASADERCNYARALVKSASRPGLIAACALNSASQLKRRLRMMRGHRISAARRAGGLVAFTAVAAAGFAVGSPAVTEALPQVPAAVAPVESTVAAVRPPVVAPKSEKRLAKVASRAKPPLREKRIAPAFASEPLPEAAPAADTPRYAVVMRDVPRVRVVRLERNGVSPEGAPVTRAQVFVFRAAGGTPPPPVELLRALKAARAGDTRVADAAAVIQHFQIKLDAPREGETQ